MGYTHGRSQISSREGNSSGKEQHWENLSKFNSTRKTFRNSNLSKFGVGVSKKKSGWSRMCACRRPREGGVPARRRVPWRLPTPACVKSLRSSYTGLYPQMCKVTPVILHGVISPEPAHTCSPTPASGISCVNTFVPPSITREFPAWRPHLHFESRFTHAKNKFLPQLDPAEYLNYILRSSSPGYQLPSV